MSRRTLLIFLLLILAGLQYRLWVGDGSWEEIVSLRRDITEQKVQNAELRARNEKLYREVQSLRNDLDSVEERARSELGLIREDETFYLIVEPKKK